MGWYEYSKPSVASQKATAARNLDRLLKKNPDAEPIVIEGTKVAKKWWGIAWCKNLENYADFDNRIARGRAYVKNGFVLDLKILHGKIDAVVSGSRMYDVSIMIDELPSSKWKEITKKASKQIGSLTKTHCYFSHCAQLMKRSC